MIVPSNNRVEKFLSSTSYRRGNSRDESTRFRLCSSLSIWGTHRAQTFGYPKFSIKISSNSGFRNVWNHFINFPNRHTSMIFAHVQRSRRKCMDAPCPAALRERLLGPSTILCTTSWRFRRPFGPCARDQLPMNFNGQSSIEVQASNDRTCFVSMTGAAIVPSNADGYRAKTERRTDEEGNKEHDSVTGFRLALRVRKRRGEKSETVFYGQPSWGICRGKNDWSR